MTQLWSTLHLLNATQAALNPTHGNSQSLTQYMQQSESHKTEHKPCNMFIIPKRLCFYQTSKGMLQTLFPFHK